MIKKTTISINNYDNHLVISANDASNLIDHVPALVYRAHLSPHGIIMGKDRPRFDLPTHRFGEHNDHFAQIKSSYSATEGNNSVLLYGAHGSGKSLLAEELGNWMIVRGLPVIMVTDPMSAAELTIIIKAVGPCMVYFDEFGKVYHEEHKREQLLPLFSDTSFRGVMFVATGNDVSEFSSHLAYRPQRFRFMIKYENRMSKETMADVLRQMKVPPQFHESFYEYGKSYSVNFDSLLCVVRESMSCKNLTELHKRIAILNVPTFPKTEWHISKVKVLRDLPENQPDGGYRLKFIPDPSGTSGELSIFENMDGYSKPVQVPVTGLVDETTPVTITHDHDREFEITFSYGFPTEVNGSNKNPPRQPRPFFQQQQTGFMPNQDFGQQNHYHSPRGGRPIEW